MNEVPRGRLRLLGYGCRYPTDPWMLEFVTPGGRVIELGLIAPWLSPRTPDRPEDGLEIDWSFFEEEFGIAAKEAP